ncbi:MAG TPA: hypothetical protein DCL44_00535 [Elusimicrobia bacterium]|nr:hypothetical protein [Elusimicrobiota bacterium]
MKKTILTLLLAALSTMAYSQEFFDLPKFDPSDIKIADVPVSSVRIPARGNRILVEKSKHLLTVYSEGAAIRVFTVDLGFGGMGKKLQEGDKLTPEGIYRIDFRNSKSQFYLSLHVTYPNKDDLEAAKKAGVHPGGQIYIHGYGDKTTYVKRRDWTYGCIALTNSDMEELWNLVPNGIVLEIRQ